MGALDLRVVLSVAGGATLAAPGPRAFVAGSSLAGIAVDALTQPWGSEDAATLLASGNLANPGALAPSAAAPVPPTAWVPRTAGASELTAFVGDLWAFAAPLSPNATSAAAARGVALGSSSWVLPCAGASSAASTGLPTGIVLTVTAVSWSFVGAPVSEIWGAAGLGAPPPAAPLHTFTSTGTGVGVALPPGSLYAGYVYKASATFTLSAAWRFTSDVSQWASPTLAGVPAAAGVRVSPADAVSGIVATVAYAPLAFVHAPPHAGTLAATPPPGSPGAALVDLFTLTTGAWVDADTLVLGSSVPQFVSTPAAALALALASGPLPSGAPPAAASIASPICAAAVSATGAALAAWTRTQAIAAALLGLDPSAYCVASFVGTAGMLAAAGGSYAPSTSMLNATVTLDFSPSDVARASSGTWPLGLAPSGPSQALSPAGYSALAAQQATLLSGATTLPGFVITSGAVPYPAPLSLFSTLSTGTTAPTADTAVLLAATVVDALGGTGVAWASPVLIPPLPVGANLNATLFFANTVA